MDKSTRGLVAVALSLTCVTTAVAGSGPKKLKQPSSFPLVISQPGSYILVSNITVPDANTTAISITADNVTLDLGGFSIMGPTVCSGGPPVTSCSPTGAGNGIAVNVGQASVSVVNGTVRGMGATGVALKDHAHVEHVRAVSNGLDGIDVGPAATVTSNIATDNGATGIFATDGAVVTGNSSRSNGSDGIFVTNGSTIIGNSSMYNGGYGLHGGGGDFGYANNVFRTNTLATVFGGTDMGHNDCNGSTTCP